MTNPTRIANVGCDSCLGSAGLPGGGSASGSPYVSGPVQIFSDLAAETYQIPDNTAMWVTAIVPEETHVVNNIRLRAISPENISIGLYERSIVGISQVFQLLSKATFGPTVVTPGQVYWDLDLPQEVVLSPTKIYGLFYSYESTVNPTPGTNEGLISTKYPGTAPGPGGIPNNSTGLSIVFTGQLTNGVLPLSITLPSPAPGTFFGPGASYFALRS